MNFKHLFLFLLINLFFSTSSFAQASCHPDQTDSYWEISLANGSKRLSDCHIDADYNCHGFVRSYFEDGCTTPSWNSSQVSAPYECPCDQGDDGAATFRTNGFYVQVCQESDGDIAYFFQNNGDAHSCVKEVTGAGIKYLSKYGTDGPLVAHDLFGSFYHLSGRIDAPFPTPEFWTYIGEINGNSNITGTSPVSFSVIDNSSITYSWSIISGYSNIYISSSSNQNSVSLTPTHSGNATLRLSITSSCGSTQTQDISLNIQTNICLEGTYTNNNSSPINLNTSNSVAVGGVTATVTCPNAASFTWSKTSGNINGWTATGGYVSFGMTSGGSISFLVTAKDASGSTIDDRNVSFHNFGSFRVTPNPAVDVIQIDANRELPFTVLIQSLDGLYKKEIVDYIGNTQINISSLPSGNYSLLVFFEEDIVNSQQLVINRS